MMRSFTFFVFIFLNTFLFSQKLGFDSTYGVNGVFFQKLGYGDDIAYSSVSLPDGKIVVSTNSGLHRFNKDYTIDTSFGNGGVKHEEIIISKFYSQSDEKILGIYYNAGNVIVYRFFPDFNIDTSYGNSGKLTFPFNGNVFRLEHAFVYSDNLFIPEGGKIIKITKNGVIDSGFGDQGYLSVSYPSRLPDGVIFLEEQIYGIDITVLPDGHIIAGGSKQIKIKEGGNDKFIYEGFLVKYDQYGNRDVDFGSNSGVEIFAKMGPDVIFEETPYVDRLFSNSKGEFFAIEGGLTMNNMYSEVRKYSSEGRFINKGMKDDFMFNIKDIQELSDGGFLLAGNIFRWQGFIMYRIDADGNMKSRVNEGTPYYYYVDLAGVTIDEQGNVLVVGNSPIDNGIQNFTFFKYTNSGMNMTLVPDFGKDGKLTYKFTPGKLQDVYSIGIQSDDKLLLVNKQKCPECFRHDHFMEAYQGVIYRVTKEGILDTSFKSNFVGGNTSIYVNKVDDSFKTLGDWYVYSFDKEGTYLHGERAIVYKYPEQLSHQGVVIAPDGKYFHIEREPWSQFQGIQIIKRNQDGTLDTTFSPINAYSFSSMFIQPDGKLIVIGRMNRSYEIDPDSNIARFNTDGSVDRTFVYNNEAGDQEQIITGSLALQSDGKILIFSYYKKAIYRLLSDGKVDVNYGVGGTVQADLLKEKNYFFQSDDKLIINTKNSSGLNELLRLNTDGSIDTSFADNGKFTFDSSFNLTSLVLQSDDKLVLAGTKDNGEYTTVVRLSNQTDESIKTTIDLSTGKNEDGTLMTTDSEIDTDWYYIRPDGSGQHPVTRNTFSKWSYAQVGPTQNSIWITGENDPQEGYFEYTSKQFVIPENAEKAKLTLRSLSFVRHWTYLVKENENGTLEEEEITRTQWMNDGAKGWLNSRNPLVEKELAPGKYHIKVKVYTLNSNLRQSLDVNAHVDYALKPSAEDRLSINSDKEQAPLEEAITFTFESTGNPVTYFWEFTDGMKIITSSETSPSVNFTTLGKHKVRLLLTYSDGSSSVSEKYIMIENSTLGIDESKVEKVNTIQISPNPTTGIFKVLVKSSSKIRVEVLDLTGKRMLTREFVGATDKQVDIQHLPAGVYIVKIETEEQTVVKKLLKK